MAPTIPPPMIVRSKCELLTVPPEREDLQILGCVVGDLMDAHRCEMDYVSFRYRRLNTVCPERAGAREDDPDFQDRMLVQPRRFAGRDGEPRIPEWQRECRFRCSIEQPYGSVLAILRRAEWKEWTDEIAVAHASPCQNCKQLIQSPKVCGIMFVWRTSRCRRRGVGAGPMQASQLQFALGSRRLWRALNFDLRMASPEPSFLPRRVRSAFPKWGIQ